jgi:hypothetical protein
MAAANTLAYYNAAEITAVESFIALAQGVSFTNILTHFFMQRLFIFHKQFCRNVDGYIICASRHNVVLFRQILSAVVKSLKKGCAHNMLV